MPVIHFTDLSVSRLKDPGTYYDDTTPAFGLRVGKKRKTWFVVRGRERLQTRMGRYPALPLAKARKQALLLLGSPIQPQVEIPKFAEAIEQFYAIHVRTMKPKTQYQMKRIIKRYFAKPLQHKRLDEITHHDVTRVTDELAKRVPGEAFHVFKYIRIFFAVVCATLHQALAHGGPEVSDQIHSPQASSCGLRGGEGLAGR